jgi:hypothetical protein
VSFLTTVLRRHVLLLTILSDKDAEKMSHFDARPIIAVLNLVGTPKTHGSFSSVLPTRPQLSTHGPAREQRLI